LLIRSFLDGAAVDGAALLLGGSPGRARRRCWMPRRRRRRPQLTTAALSFIGAGIILHVGIGLRWLLVLKPKRDS